jgi:hypothetical protein
LTFGAMDGRGSSERTPGFMKAVAAALVLIAGAAVVLWYANTLNSWVLGGLIGGLAALLLSIPISLTLFSYLSRRHDERLKAEAEVSRVQIYDSPTRSTRMMRRIYEAQGYALSEGQSLSEEEIYEAYYQQHDGRHVPTAHHLSAPSSQRLPVQSHSINHLPITQRGSMHAPSARPSTRQLYDDVPLMEQREPASKRATTRRMYYPGMPGYVPGHNKHRSQALRTARLEAAQHQEDDVDVVPSHLSRPLSPSRRTSRPLAGQTDRLQPQRVDEEAKFRPRSRRTIDSVPPQARPSRSLPPAGGSTAHYESSLSMDLHTDHLAASYYPQTGQIAGEFEEEQDLPMGRTPLDLTTGNFTHPLVRRAPYLYDDDDLRQELAQQVEEPMIRRSSRFETPGQDDDYDAYK